MIKNYIKEIFIKKHKNFYPKNYNSNKTVVFSTCTQCFFGTHVACAGITTNQKEYVFAHNTLLYTKNIY